MNSQTTDHERKSESGVSLYQGFVNSDQYKLWKTDAQACWDQLCDLAQGNSSLISTTMLLHYIATGAKKRNEPSHALLTYVIICTYNEYAFLFKHAIQAISPENLEYGNVDLIKTSSHNIPMSPKRCGFEGDEWDETNNVPCIKLKVYFNVKKDDNSFSAFEKLNDKMIVDLWMKEDFTPIHVLFCFASED